MRLGSLCKLHVHNHVHYTQFADTCTNTHTAVCAHRACAISVLLIGPWLYHGAQWCAALKNACMPAPTLPTHIRAVPPS